MALTNVRLGVWIKNPNHPAAARADSGTRSRLQAALRRMRDGWFEPGAWYVLREALGAAKPPTATSTSPMAATGRTSAWSSCCTHVLCFDVGCDRDGEGLDIGRAIALARNELGVDIDLDPRPVLPEASSLSGAMAVAGMMSYPPPGNQQAQLVYAKAVLTQEASWDLHAFKNREPRFPNHSTSQQMFTDEQFEAYRTLGYEAGGKAVAQLNIPGAVARTGGRAGQRAGRALRVRRPRLTGAQRGSRATGLPPPRRVQWRTRG